MELRRLLRFKFFVVLFLISEINSEDRDIEDVTGRVFQGSSDKNNGVLAAFGDFNSDRLIDLFFIFKYGKEVGIYFANENGAIFSNKGNITCSLSGNLIITGVVPGDFNGDSRMDVLLILQNKNDPTKNFITVQIIQGNLTEFINCENPAITIENMSVEPLVLDYNGDMIPDLYGETVDGMRTVWLMKTNWTTEIINITETDKKIRPIHSNAFVNLNNDSATDIIVTTENKSFETWRNEGGHYNLHSNSFFPEEAVVIGQSAFLDIDSDGNLDHIVPICYDSNCINATILLRRDLNNTYSKWISVTDKSIWDGWGFYNNSSYPITLHVGDYNLDGYPDLLTIMFYNQTVREAIILENQFSDGYEFSRHFVVKRLFKDKVKNVILAAFYDIYQDGNLDFLFVSYNATTNKYTTSTFENKGGSGVCFLKILVLSGLQSLKNLTIAGYGVNQPGPFISYKTTQLDGSPRQSCATQLSQSAHFALQLPYTVFGLGETPNFVEELRVGIPQSREFSKVNSRETYKTTLKLIIPNSQIIAIPLREKSQIEWSFRLFVKPFNHQVLNALIALAGTCVLIVLIIGGLHWKEKIADKKEKLQDAHKFHFDAM